MDAQRPTPLDALDRQGRPEGGRWDERLRAELVAAAERLQERRSCDHDSTPAARPAG